MATKVRATQALVNLMTSVPGLDDDVWFTDIRGAFGLVTGVPFPTLNGVWVHDTCVDVHAARHLLESAPGTSPMSLQCCSAARDAVSKLAVGMVSGPEVPLMTLTDLPPMTDRLEIRELSPAEFDERTDVAAAAFEVPAADMRAATSLFGRTPGYRMYLGSVDGQPVTTAVSIRSGDAVGIFDVATPVEHQGHGYGAAITVRALHDAFAQGATWAWLQSSPQGYGVYHRLGFRTVDTWSLWLV